MRIAGLRVGFLFAMLLVVAGSISIGAQSPPTEARASTNEELDAQAEQFADTLRTRQSEIDEFRTQLESATGEDVDVLRMQIAERRMEMLDEFDSLCSNILEQEEQGYDTAELRTFVEPLLGRAQSGLIRIYEELTAREGDLRTARKEAADGEVADIESELVQVREQLDRILGLLFENVERIEQMGLPAESERAQVIEILSGRADTEAARIRLVQERLETLGTRLADEPDSATIQSEISVSERRLENLATSLQGLVKILGDAGVSTTDYQTLLIQTTGDVTSGLLDTGVAMSLFDQWRERAMDWVADNGPTFLIRIVVVVLILMLFRVLANVTRRVLRKVFAASKVNLSQLFQETAISLASRAVFLLGVLVALSQLGVSLGPILAGLGVAGFIVGFALQDTLSNFAAGGMILAYRPFDVGDMVEAAGVFGQVERMSLVSTTFLTIDHQTLIVPNSKIWGDVIRNVTAQKIRRVDLEFGISYSDDIPHAERVLATILEQHDKIMSDPAPMIRLHRLGESSVDFVVRPWCKTEDYWDVYWDVTREVKMRFDAEGISIPFPQRDVHMYPATESS